MKSFLAADTAAGYLTVIARNRAGRTFTSHLPDCAMNHSVMLLETVEKTLENAGMGLADCDFFACVVGAGSFTGIRIGIATVKGFCTALSRPALPVTSFDAVAYTTGRIKTLALVSAGHDHYYAAGYDEEKRLIFPPAYLPREEAAALAKAEGYTVAGYDALPFEGSLRADMAAGLLAAVEGKSADEKNFVPSESLQAVYVRRSQAEENHK